MKKTFILFFLLVSSIMLGAQTPQIDQRVTYIWDVTYSMHGGRMGGGGSQTVLVGGQKFKIEGYNPAFDIYDDVMEAMIDDINRQNARTEIVVIPFNDKVCDEWRYQATTEGKNKLIEKIRLYANVQQTFTNISNPVEYAMEKVFTPDVTDHMKLMTDGNDNVDMAHFKNLMQQWCEMAQSKNVYGYYVMLTSQANDNDLTLILKEQCRMTLGSGININPPRIQMGDRVIVDAKNDYSKPFDIKVDIKYAENLPSNVKVHISAEENPYFNLNEEVELSAETRSVRVQPNYKMGVNELRSNLSIDSSSFVSLHYELVENKGKVIEFWNTEGQVELLNKSLKTLKVGVKP